MANGRYSLTIDGVEISRHRDRKLANAKAKMLLRNPNQVATIQDLRPEGKSGARVCIVWRRIRDGGWNEHRHHTIPGKS